MVVSFSDGEWIDRDNSGWDKSVRTTLETEQRE